MEHLFNQRKEELKEFQSWFNRNKKIEPKEIPENIFKQCGKCHQSIPIHTLIDHLYTCPHCQYHFRLSARERLRQLLDDGTFKELYKNDITIDREDFPSYQKKLETSQKQTGLNEAVVCGVGKINNTKCVICVMDSHFMMGSMGRVVGEKITKSVEYATRKKLSLIITCASGGARMQEGMDSLVQMSKISSAIKRHSNEKLLYITLLTHPTTGGVSASFGMLGDIIISEPQALIGFAGRRVIEKTIKEKLPEDFQTAEFLLEQGFVDMIVNRQDMKQVLGQILKMHEVTYGK